VVDFCFDRRPRKGDAAAVKKRNLDEIIDDAYEALERADVDAARRFHEEACKVAPTDRDTALLEIDLLESEDQGEEAVAACEELYKRSKKDLVVGVRLGTLLLDIYDDVNEARPYLEEALRRLDKGEMPRVGVGPDELAEATAQYKLELLLTLADCRAADHDPRGALAAAEAAHALDKTDPAALLAVASAKFDLCELDEAERLIARAIDQDAHFADAFWLRGRILTSKGDDKGAERAFDRAVLIDRERFSPPVRIDEDAFVKLMEQSLSELPEKVRSYLKNVAVAVEDIPPVARLKESDPPLSPGSLGLYEGTPPSLSPGDDPWAHHPRHITLFRKNIESAARDEDDLKDLISTTLLHEIGHYLGLDEDDLDERGLG
jgi:predicted Zn-dependent protease with MMP-like domain